MSDSMIVKKTKGVWMITVNGPKETKDVPEQNNIHQIQQTDEKLEGGAWRLDRTGSLLSKPAGT